MCACVSSPSSVVDGQTAIADLARLHPDAHTFFGGRDTIAELVDIISQPHWVVQENDGCWVLAEDINYGVYEIHWFCPSGASLPALRAMLLRLFDEFKAVILVGTTPPGHQNERAARVINRAVGAVQEDGYYHLSKARLLAYNRGTVKA